MDIDDSTNTNSNPDDIEQNFLNQFQCLGTTDRDELVTQFQSIGGELNYTTARFFLDMNNWNLQAAVGCYFDFMAGAKLLSMRILENTTIGEGESITPNTPFTQSWIVQNNGDTTWPEGTFLCSTADQQGTRVPVPSLQPNESTKLTINLVSPSELGQSFAKEWRLCTPGGTYFGATIFSLVEVSEAGTLALTQQLSQLQTSSTATSQNNAVFQNPQSQPQTQPQPQPQPPNQIDDFEMW